MSPKENLHRLIDQLPEDKVEALERLAVQMMREDEAFGQPRAGMSFEEALAYTNETIGETLRKLAQ